MIFKQLFLSLLCTFGLRADFDSSKIDTYLQNCQQFSGAVLITRNDTVILKKAYGYANYEFEVPNDVHTKFPIASNTKSFTAIAILKLQEMGLLRVQDKLSSYIPDFPQDDTITLHHLLTHTSGIQNYYKQWTDIGNCDKLDEMISKVKTWSLEFEPGSKYSYSNTGYLLLAHVIEKVSGKPFELFLQKHIFAPLHMNNSGNMRKDQLIKNKAAGYYVKDGQLYNAPLITNPQTLLGNGDIYCSLDDLHKWDIALHAGNLLCKASLDMLFACHVAMEGSADRAHGYGWFIDKKYGKRVAEYSGALAGYLSKLIRFIDDNITIVILTNVENFEQFCKISDELSLIVCDTLRSSFENHEYH